MLAIYQNGQLRKARATNGSKLQPSTILEFRRPPTFQTGEAIESRGVSAIKVDVGFRALPAQLETWRVFVGDRKSLNPHAVRL